MVTETTCHLAYHHDVFVQCDLKRYKQPDISFLETVVSDLVAKNDALDKDRESKDVKIKNLEVENKKLEQNLILAW